MLVLYLPISIKLASSTNTVVFDESLGLFPVNLYMLYNYDTNNREIMYKYHYSTICTIIYVKEIKLYSNPTILLSIALIL